MNTDGIVNAKAPRRGEKTQRVGIQRLHRFSQTSIEAEKPRATWERAGAGVRGRRAPECFRCDEVSRGKTRVEDALGAPRETRSTVKEQRVTWHPWKTSGQKTFPHLFVRYRSGSSCALFSNYL